MSTSNVFLLLAAVPSLLAAQTSVFLTASPNPSVLGARVTLTAAITPASASGRVTFFDGVNILGASKVPGGMATLSTSLLPSGTHKLTAAYYNDPSPVATTSNVVLQTVRAGAGGTFNPRSVPVDVSFGGSAIVGDFNGDGIADLAFFKPTSTVRVALGKGDGTFQSPVDYNLTGLVTAVAYGDFNGDGIPDLAVCTYSAGSPGGSIPSEADLYILPGNGDGTFRSAAKYSSGIFPIAAMAAGDFNSDGKADLVLAYAVANSHGVNILFGHGDGTFGAPAAYSDLGPSLAMADFNGDGKPDLALAGLADASRQYNIPVNPHVLLGKGDGTAYGPIPFNPGNIVSTIFSLVAGDFNGDGIVDLAVGGDDSNATVTTWILLGNGDGTFRQAGSYPSAAAASGDFNGDGITDLVLTDFIGNMTGILLGNGDGTFRQGLAFPAGVVLAVADFNRDGIADILTGNSDGTSTVLLGTPSASFQLTATGGTPQSAPVGYGFPTPLQATLRDSHGTPVPGATVSFTAPPGGGTFGLPTQPSAFFLTPYPTLPVTALTNASGVASVSASANSVAGSYIVTASYQGATTSFSLTNISISRLAVTGGTPQSTTVGTAFPNALQVKLTDPSGNPVSGINVSFTWPVTGASASLSSATVVTDANGMASVTATANSIAGSYTVSASAGNLTATFSLTNLVGSPGSITATGTPQTTQVGTAFPSPLQVTVKDAGGNPVSGVTVTFAQPAAGPSAAGAVLSNNTAVTNASGVASVTATANNVPGSYVVTASAATLSTSFSLTNLLPSSVTLTVSPSPSVFGAPVTLTATVSPANVTGGVSFYDGGTPLGAKTLASGSASITTILLPAGSRKLTAFYSGGGSYLPSKSTVTQQVSAAAGGGFSIQNPLSVSPAAPTTVAVGDFNGDGKADLVIPGGAGSSTVTVMLGRGDGSFQAPVNYAVGANPGFVAVADFNGDGISDLAVNGSAVNILLGNGDGTFRQGASYPGAPGCPMSVADFNLDGKPDLAFCATVWIGNGDGTFVSTPPPPISSSPKAATVSDINGDGKPDILLTFSSCFTMITPMGHVQTFCGDNVFDYLGKGDGTFQPSSVAFSSFSPFTPYPSIVFVTGDFNGDSKTDIVYSDGYSSSFLPGNGDGTFGQSQTFDPFSFDVPATVAIASGDFNGDGIPDLATLRSDNTLFIRIGHGDGTFQTAGALAVPSHDALSVADFNGDSRADLILANAAGKSISLLLGNAPGSGLQLTATSGTPQSARTGAAFAVPLTVTLLNNGAPASGATVTFSAPTISFEPTAVLSSATATTDASGRASVTAIASQIPGASYTVTATAQGISVFFTLTNTGQQIVQLTTSGPQSTNVGAAFPNVLRATVQDLAGPASGVVVRFTPPSSGASAVLSSATAVTDASGVATVTATANGIAGTYSVRASVGDGTGRLSGDLVLSNLTNGSPNPNLAQGKAATQSSTLPGVPSAAASSAVDGNTDGAFYDGSVTATNADPNAWWQVDLGASATIGSVAIWNRTDCCGSRLSDYWVFISNTPFLATDTPATLQNRAGTFASHQTTAPSPSATIAVNGAQGRYVRVQLFDTDYLSLAEVQVFGTGGAPPAADLAQGKTATQSSTYSGNASSVAGSAVDGNTDGAFFDGSVTATNADPNAWWQVDLGASATISSIVIWNRTDCCGSRLSDYWVFVSDTPFLATDTPATLQNRSGTFASHQTSAPNPSTTIPQLPPCLYAVPPCLPPVPVIQGRYVRVQLSGTDYLSLAEVQVFGTGGTPPPPSADLALGKTAIQSSTYPGITSAASSAVDGNTDGNFFDGSVTATNLDPSAWWQVDLGSAASVSSIVVWNRTDCCGGRLSDYWVFVSNTPFLASDTPATLQNRSGTFASHQTAAPNPSTTISVGASGRYVRIQLTNADYLSLSEVQVFGQ